MNDERFDELMRDAVHTFRTPPDADYDGMWAEIERRSAEPTESTAPMISRRGRWLTIAATLVVGIGLGRVSTMLWQHSPAPSSTVAEMPPQARSASEASPATLDHAALSVSNPYGAETTKFLGQTAVLLTALRSEVDSGRTNEDFVNRAGDLLTTTRLLLDSPAAADPSMRNLLEDLELVLAQVVRLHNGNTRIELDLINRALEQRDVIPRLRTAVADYSAN